MLLDTAKHAWKDNKTSIQYVLDDATRAFLTLSDDFFYEDMDIFVEDTTKNQQQIEALKNLMQPAMQMELVYLIQLRLLLWIMSL